MKLEPTEHYYFIGIGLPSKEDRLFSALKASYSRVETLSSPPHITLKPPFFHRNESYIIEKLTSCCAQVEEFEINVSLVGSFAHKRNSTLFLAPTKTSDLKKLERQISTAFSFLPPDPDFHPHLTIGQRVPHQEVQQLKAQLRAQALKLKLRVETVTLFRKKGNQPWTAYVQCPLKTEE